MWLVLLVSSSLFSLGGFFLVVVVFRGGEGVGGGEGGESQTVLVSRNISRSPPNELCERSCDRSQYTSVRNRDLAQRTFGLEMKIKEVS